MAFKVRPSTVICSPSTVAFLPVTGTSATFTVGGFFGWSGVNEVCMRWICALICCASGPLPPHLASVPGFAGDPSLAGVAMTRQASLGRSSTTAVTHVATAPCAVD
ncbi:hypothetical protein ACFQ10_48000 [Streptomyces indonesiensis]